MIYSSAQEWNAAPQKNIMLFGMSGLGKTYISNMLRDGGDWFHYSVDYRIGTRYMGEHIADSFKREAMKVPVLRDLLMSDSIYIASNITFDNLEPLSNYLGKPGNPDQGGLSFDEYMRRQEQHRAAETAAMLDTPHFMERAAELYGYQNFICDTSGSICEVVDPENPEDPVLSELSKHVLMVWIKGSDAHTAELVRRFDKAPKPMYYQPSFIQKSWDQYVTAQGGESQVNPDDFIRWTYARALDHRAPRYAAMTKWGVTVDASDVAAVKTPEDFNTLIARALEQRDATA